LATVRVSRRGAVAASLFGSSSSLGRKQKAKLNINKRARIANIKIRVSKLTSLKHQKSQLLKYGEQRVPLAHLFE
jgi:hypothetical protein